MFGLARQLTRMGVLGLNRRNAEYTLTYNPRRLYPLVDDKLATKKLAQHAGIAVPELYEVVETNYQVRTLPKILEQHPDFVVKPAHGSGGEGILVIASRSKQMYKNGDGSLLSQEELCYHISNILSGTYSLGGQPDKALIEYRVRPDPLFEAISYQGVPDIRVILFLGVPVMSMVRLPTRMSGGRANLHQGALGAGVDITNGITLSAVWRNDIIDEHPDTGNRVAGIKIPGWEKLLRLASRCYQLTGLGYQGVDIVLDKDKGPLILELNARPGLNIQIANLSGLLPRLNLVKQNHGVLNSVEECVAFAQEYFGASGKMEI